MVGLIPSVLSLLDSRKERQIYGTIPERLSALVTLNQSTDCREACSSCHVPRNYPHHV
jgi:hypothetical protein